MVKDYASYCIVGHSERRENFKESDKTIAKKLAAITNAGLNGILCIGESYNLRSNNHYHKYLENQLRKALENIVDFSKVIIAYEPIWAIGTNNIATNKEILEITDIINTTINDICPGFNNKIFDRKNVWRKFIWSNMFFGRQIFRPEMFLTKKLVSVALYFFL